MTPSGSPLWRSTRPALALRPSPSRRLTAGESGMPARESQRSSRQSPPIPPRTAACMEHPSRIRRTPSRSPSRRDTTTRTAIRAARRTGALRLQGVYRAVRCLAEAAARGVAASLRWTCVPLVRLYFGARRRLRSVEAECGSNHRKKRSMGPCFCALARPRSRQQIIAVIHCRESPSTQNPQSTNALRVLPDRGRLVRIRSSEEARGGPAGGCRTARQRPGRRSRCGCSALASSVNAIARQS